MRIIAGKRKGLRLSTFRNRDIRPTADFLKELIFNVLGDVVKSSCVLDIFAGTGSLGIEALSRGAARAIFIESNSFAQRLIQRNLEKCDLAQYAAIIGTNANSALKLLSGRKLKFDLIIADPPYQKKLVLETIKSIEENDLLKPGGWFVIEQSSRAEILLPDKYVLKTQKIKGDSAVLFFVYEREAESSDLPGDI